MNYQTRPPTPTSVYYEVELWDPLGTFWTQTLLLEHHLQGCTPRMLKQNHVATHIMNGVLGRDSVLQGYTGPGTT